MNYWQTPEEAGLNEEQKTEIINRLWQERLDESSSTCPDCGVKSGEKHTLNCDVARCINCGAQHLMCDCDNPEVDIYTGLWPGIKECYEQRLICRGDYGVGEWSFDLNSVK